MVYYPFRKTVIGKNRKPVRVWYIWYINPDTGARVQRVCKNENKQPCRNKSEVEQFISTLPAINKTEKNIVALETNEKQISVHEIVKDMFIPGSKHYDRLVKYGKNLSKYTLQINRRFITYIDKLWGDLDITEITSTLVDDYLLENEHSGSWKNSFIENMGEVLDEAQWYGAKFQNRPVFHRFARNSKKPDILSTEELNRLFVPYNFENYDLYMMFLTTVSAGMRLGEIRAMRKCQVLVNQNKIFIDGFMRDNERMDFNKKGSDDNPKYRVTVIPDYVMSKLSAYICQKNLSEKDLVFTKHGEPLRKEYCEEALRKAVKKAEIDSEKRIVPHSLRYTYVTRMRRLLSAEEVRGLAGHTDIEMTEEYNRAALPELIQSVSKPEIEQSANLLFK